ncbi:MAG TPA: chorismate synthase [Candidatus Saccharimonadales bacterium]|nr:chorismate synthase [Candidatus Saccharimonadales bacterium]
MAGNTFGQLFRITTFGESHGGAVGCVIDGCPPNIAITPEDIQKELDRRKPGQSEITTPRAEKDKVNILSGVYEGVTTGTPIMMLAHNEDIRPEDYDQLKKLYRPGHADYTFQAKYGTRDWRGSGRASARETLARVAAGAIAKKYLKEKLNVEIISYVQQVGDIEANVDNALVTQEQVESNIIRCPDNIAANEMIKLVEEVRDNGDSVGGIIVGLIKNCPIGLGEPVFDKLNADLGKAMLSINAVKGFDIGSGFGGVGMRGSEHNDEFYTESNGRIRTRTNNAGGTLGGISNGEDIYFRVAIKPVSTISKKQKTLDLEKNEVEVEATGRHDPCVLPRAIPIVDAMSALVVMDHHLRNKAQNS